MRRGRVPAVSVDICQAASAATGIDQFADRDYLWLVRERINNLERMFNVKKRFSRKDDVFPRRIPEEVLLSGESVGIPFESDILLNEYYRVRGRDLETAFPPRPSSMS